MHFSEAMLSVTRHGEHWQATVSEDWLQGRSAFGGLQAALALRAMRELVPADMPLRSLQTTFVAPVPARSEHRSTSFLVGSSQVSGPHAGCCWPTWIL